MSEDQAVTRVTNTPVITVSGASELPVRYCEGPVAAWYEGELTSNTYRLCEVQLRPNPGTGSMEAVAERAGVLTRFVWLRPLGHDAP
jgi:hypothetical protein